MSSTAIQLDETNDKASEFVGLLEIHQMAGIGYNHTPRVRDSRLDYTRMCVNIGNVSIAREEQRGNMDFVQAGQSRLRRARVIVVGQIALRGVRFAIEVRLSFRRD